MTVNWHAALPTIVLYLSYLIFVLCLIIHGNKEERKQHRGR